ncbi:hypothetical protein BH10PSE6_BH10PSE6_38620 [soil metagenome]
MPSPKLNMPAAEDKALFGGNQAQEMQAVGQRLGRASDTVFSIHERMAKDANDTRVQDFNNQYITGEREILRTGPDAYYKQSGADAINGAGATTERLTKLKDQLLGQAPNEYQRQKLRPILDAHFAASADAVAKHATDQQAAYGRKVAATATETSRADAVANPANLPNAMVRAEGAARILYEGQAPEIVEAEGRKAGLSVVSAVIGDQLGRNDPEGLALFRQYRDQLDPRDRRVLGAAAETLTNTVAAADWLRDRSASLAVAPAPTGDAALDAVNVASASVAEPPPVTSWGGRLLEQDGVAGHRQRMAEIEDRRRALTALNEQEFAGHPVRLRANQTAIDTDSAQGRAAVKAQADGLYADLRRYLMTSGPDGRRAITLPPATLMSRFTDEQQASIARQVDRAIEGRPPATDPQTWYAIQQGLTGGDATQRQRWASTNLVPFMDRLTAEDYAVLTKLQTTVRSNEGGADSTRLQLVTRMANQAMREQGIDSTPRSDSSPDSDAAQAATFHRALQNELSAFESKGRQATESEAYGIVNGLMGTAIKGSWIKPRNRPASVTLVPDIPSIDGAFDQRNVMLIQAGPEDMNPRAASGHGNIQQASLANDRPETPDEKERRILRESLPPENQPSPEPVPDWRPDFFIPEYPFKPPKPPEAPAPAYDNMIALHRNSSRSPSK